MYCSTVLVPMTGDSWWSSSWPAADTRWSAATSAGCSPLRRVILHPVSTSRYFYVCRYFSVCWVTMTWWPVWRTADTDICTNFTANYLSLIRRQQVISGQDSAQWAVGCSGLTMWQSWHSNWPHISRLQIPPHGHASHCQGPRGLLESVRFVRRSFYLFGQPLDDSCSLINGFERNTEYLLFTFCPTGETLLDVFWGQILNKKSWTHCKIVDGYQFRLWSEEVLRWYGY